MRVFVSSLLFFFLIGSAGAFETTVTEPASDFETDSAAQFTNPFSFTFRNLSYGLVQKPVDSVLNPGNQSEVPGAILETDFRPDLSFQVPRLYGTLKARADLGIEKCEDGVCKGEKEYVEDYYINEWLVRVEPLNSLFISYGREDLQWGPSMLLSPSNPFDTDNGRDKPKMEVPGADYGRLIWSPDINWTASVIVNTGEGNKELISDFHITSALKIDITADRGYLSLIFARDDETENSHLGFFGNWNVNDAWMLYTEESFRDQTNQIEALVGGSYTFINGSMLSLEYFYNGAGNNEVSIIELLAGGSGPTDRMPLVRKNYMMLQYYYRDMFDRWNALLRGISNLDDHSATLLGLVEINIGDHLQLFASGTYFLGDVEDEFGIQLDYRAMAGMEISF